MKHSHNLQMLAKTNRKNATPAETKLWSILRKERIGVSFRRQHQIGSYIADFICLKKKLIIECDGGQHNMQKNEDKIRTLFLEQQGYKVIRFWNNDILYNTDGVYLLIKKALQINS